MRDELSSTVVVVDRELCIGSGLCIVYAPDTFAHDAEEKATVRTTGGDPIEVIQTVVDACPTGALRMLPQPPRSVNCK